MASINPSPFCTPMDALLAHFHLHCMYARAAFLERDAIWGSDNQALRSEINRLHREFNRRKGNERWLKHSWFVLEKKVEDERRKREALEEKRVEMEREVAELRAEKIAAAEGGLMDEGEIRVSEREERVEIEMALEEEKRTEVLEKKKGDPQYVEMILKESVVVEELRRSLEAELKEVNRIREKESLEVSELRRRIGDLEKEKGVMEPGSRKTISEKSAENERILNDKVELKKRIGELVDQVRVLEIDSGEKRAEIERIVTEKMALEEEKRTIVDRVEVLEWDKATMEVEIWKTKSEKNAEVERILNEKVALEVLKNRREAELKNEICLLVDRIRDLEMDQAGKRTEIERIMKEKRAILEEKRRAEECVKEKNSKLADRIEVLERNKLALEAEVSKKEMEGKCVTLRMQNVKKILEADKRLEEEAEKQISGFLETIMDLEKEKEALEAEVSRIEVLEREKSEAMQMILNGKMAMEAEKDDYGKKNLELVDRISILEREKRGLEVAIREKDEVIKVLDQENSWLEIVKKELEKGIKELASKLKEDVQLFQRLHLTDNVGTLSTPWQNEGQNSAGVAYSSEHHGSVNDNVENSDGKSEDGMTRTNAVKRKRSIIKCEELGKKIIKPACEHLPTSTGVVDDKPVPSEKNTEMDSTRRTNGSSGGDVLVALRWEVDQDLLDAFDVDPELCLKAVCALYRQHKRLPDSADTSPSPGCRVFKPEYSLQAIPLGEYLTTMDPECRRMKKLVGKLNKFDPLAIGVCRSIAKQHYKQVFEIYKKKEDPIFLS